MVVVGAGLGGLSAALRLAGAGREVTVVEREQVPGGRAGLREEQGFRFDTGPTVLTMPDLIAEPEAGRALTLWGDAMQGGLFVVLPMAVGLVAVGVAANLAQVGFVASPEALKPKPSRLNPLPGIKRMFGAKSLWSACKELIKLAILGGLAYRALSDFVPALLDAGRLGPAATALA